MGKVIQAKVMNKNGKKVYQFSNGVKWEEGALKARYKKG